MAEADRPRRSITALFYGVFTPVALVGRPYWRRRLGLGFDRSAATYWHDRRGRPVRGEDLTKPR
jgi:hypothetical protein